VRIFVTRYASCARTTGKRGGFRSIVLFCAGERAIFVHGFANSARATIRPDELLGLKRLAAEMLGHDDAALAKAMQSAALEGVGLNDQDLSE
jgi:hypothetical protein